MMNNSDPNDTSSKVKQWLQNIAQNSLSFRAGYLLYRRYHLGHEVFGSEDLAQYTVWLLIENFAGIGPIPSIPEFVVEFLLGSKVGTINIVAANVKATYFDNNQSFNGVRWEEFYYLHFLHKRKLFHLTSSIEKRYAAQLCAQRLKINQADSTSDNKVFDHQTSPELMVDTYANQNIRKFVSLNSIALAKNAEYSVTICGFHKSMMGLGEDARRMFDLLTGIGYRVELFDCSPGELENDESLEYYSVFETRRPSSEVVIFCMPLFEMARAISILGDEFFKSRYIIGYWPWELSSFPDGWGGIIELADEIWASSHFLKAIYEEHSRRPVHHVPLCVEIDEGIDTELALQVIRPDAVSFLTAFDFNSTIERKNPIGAVRAFKIAFNERQHHAQLILKSIHGTMKQSAMQKLIAEINDDSRITLIDGPISRSSLNGLISNSTAYLSLHRSEGFGRFLVEAMLLQTAVIATDWSGSRDYVNCKTGFPVDLRLRPVGSDEYPFASGVWAEPDLDSACQIMRSIADDISSLNHVTRNALELVTQRYSYSAVQNIILARMSNIKI